MLYAGIVMAMALVLGSQCPTSTAQFPCLGDCIPQGIVCGPSGPSIGWCPPGQHCCGQEPQIIVLELPPPVCIPNGGSCLLAGVSCPIGTRPSHDFCSFGQHCCMPEQPQNRVLELPPPQCIMNGGSCLLTGVNCPNGTQPSTDFCSFSQHCCMPEPHQNRDYPRCADRAIRIGTQCLIISDDTDRRTWHEAKKACENKRRRLAKLEDPTSVAHYVAENYSKGTIMHFGASDTATEGSWSWLDNKPLGAQFPWYNGAEERYGQEPNGGTRENCMVIWVGYGYADYHCNVPQRYICS